MRDCFILLVCLSLVAQHPGPVSGCGGGPRCCQTAEDSTGHGVRGESFSRTSNPAPRETKSPGKLASTTCCATQRTACCAAGDGGRNTHSHSGEMGRASVSCGCHCCPRQPAEQGRITLQNRWAEFLTTLTAFPEAPLLVALDYSRISPDLAADDRTRPHRSARCHLLDCVWLI